MPKTRIAVLLLLVASVLVLWPAPARAESDILAFLEELSGPGPFHTRIPVAQGFGIRLVCGSRSTHGAHMYSSKYGDKAEDARPCIENSPDITWYLYAHYSFTSTGNEQQFGVTPARRIHAHTVDVFAKLRVNPAVDIGMGVGATYFTDGRDTTTFGPIGNFTYTPVNLVVRPGQFWRDNRWTRSFGIEYSQTVRVGTLNSLDFGGPAGVYHAGTELNARTTIWWDPIALFWKR